MTTQNHPANCHEVPHCHTATRGTHLNRGSGSPLIATTYAKSELPLPRFDRGTPKPLRHKDLALPRFHSLKRERKTVALGFFSLSLVLCQWTISAGRWTHSTTANGQRKTNMFTFSAKPSKSVSSHYRAMLDQDIAALTGAQSWPQWNTAAESAERLLAVGLSFARSTDAVVVHEELSAITSEVLATLNLMAELERRGLSLEEARDAIENNLL